MIIGGHSRLTSVSPNTDHPEAADPEEDDAEVTEADIQALTALGEQDGQILPAEREIIDSLLQFSDRPIKEIMTPRVD